MQQLQHFQQMQQKQASKHAAHPTSMDTGLSNDQENGRALFLRDPFRQMKVVLGKPNRKCAASEIAHVVDTSTRQMTSLFDPKARKDEPTLKKVRLGSLGLYPQELPLSYSYSATFGVRGSVP